MTLEERRAAAQANYKPQYDNRKTSKNRTTQSVGASQQTSNPSLEERRAAAQSNYRPQFYAPSEPTTDPSRTARKAFFDAEQQEKYLKGTASKFWSKSSSGITSRTSDTTPNATELNRRYLTLTKQAGILEGIEKNGGQVKSDQYADLVSRFQQAYQDYDAYQKSYADYTSEETTRKRREETQRQLDQQLEAQRSKNLAAQYGYQMPDRYVAQLEQQGAKADQEEIDRLRRQLEQDDEILAGYEQRRETERLLGLDLDSLKSELDAKKAQQEELWQNYLSGTRGISWGATRESLDMDLAREIEDLQNEYNKAYNLQWRQTQGEQYGALANQSDFPANSQYLQSNDPDAMLAQLKQQESDLVYRLSNDPNAPASLSTQLNQVQQQIRDYQALQAQIGSTYYDMTGENDAAQRFQYATDQERAVYYYLVNTGRYQEAADYADYLDYNLNERRQAQRVESAQEFARRHPVLGTLASVPQSLVSGVGTLDLIVQGAENANNGKPLDFNTAWQDPYYSANTTRGTIAQDLNEKSGTIDESVPIIGGMGAGNLYQIGTSALDSAAVLALTAATGIPPIAGTSLLGGAAATAASHDAHNRGLSDSQAIATGIMAGIWETMFEYVSIDNLLKPSVSAGSLRSALGAAAKQAGIEASEEFLTTAANTLSDLAINGDQAQLMEDYQRYLAQGDSASQAAAKTFGSALNTALQDALAGAISGGVMGGGKAALGTMLPTRTTSTLPQASPAVEQAQALASSIESDAANARAAEWQAQAAEASSAAAKTAQPSGAQADGSLHGTQANQQATNEASLQQGVASQETDRIGIQFYSEPGMTEGGWPIGGARLNQMVRRANEVVSQALASRELTRDQVQQSVSDLLTREFGMKNRDAATLAEQFARQYQAAIDQGSARLYQEMQEGDGPRQASQANNTWQNATQMTSEEREMAGMEPVGEAYTTRSEAYSNDQARALIDRMGWDGAYQYLMQNDTWNPADVKAAVEVGRHLLSQARTETDQKVKESLYEQAGQIGMRYQQDRSAAGRSLQASAQYASDPVLEAVGKVRQVIEQSSEQMTEEQQTAAVSDVVERAEEMQRVIDETDSFEDSLVRHLVEKAKTRLAKSNQGNHRVLSAVVQDLSNFINRHIETHTASSEARTAFGRISDYLNNAEDYNRISEAARDALLSEYKEGSAEYDMLQSLDGANMLYDFVHANRSIVSAVRQAMKSDGITFAKLLTRYIESGDISEVKDSVFNFISDRVVLNNPETSLPLLRDAVDAYIDSALDESKQRRIASIRRRIEKMPGNARRSVMSRVIEAYRIGMFDSPESQADAIKYIAGTDVSSSDASAISSAFKAIVDDSSSKVALIDLIERYAKDRGITKTVVRGKTRDVSGIIHKILEGSSRDELYQFAQASLDGYIMDKYGDPAGLGQRLKTIQVLSHLFNPRTWMRNLVGNATFGTVDSAANRIAATMDILIGKRTGTRSTVAGPNFFSREAMSAKKRALAQSVAAVYLDLDLNHEANRYGQVSQRTFRMNSDSKVAALTRAMSKLERNLIYALTSSDQFAKGGVQATQQARIQQMLDAGQIDQDRLGVDVTPEEYAAWRGKELAKYRTFQDNSRLAAGARSIHDTLNLAGIGDSGRTINGKTVKAFGLGDLLMPYPGVPGNIASRALEYSPVGLAKGIVDLSKVLKSGKNATVQNQSQAVLELSRGITGAALIGLAAFAAANGIIRSTDDDDNLDEKRLNSAEGINGIQVNLSALLRGMSGGSTEWQKGDRLAALDYLQPVNAWLALGCFVDSYLSGDKDYDAFTASVDAFGKSIEEFPVLQTIQNIVDDVRYNDMSVASAALQESASSIMSSIVPSFVRNIATASDHYQRDTTSGEYGAVSLYDWISQSTGMKSEFLKALAEFFDNTLKVSQSVSTIMSAVPGLRQTLPMKLDNYGQPMGYTGSRPLDVANALVLPGSVYSYNQRELTKALSEISAYTGTDNFYPSRNPVKMVEYNGTKHEMTFDQRQEYQKTYGTVYYDMANELMQSQQWQDADPMTRADMLSKIEEIASAQARVNFMDSIGQDYTGSDSANLIAKLDDMAAGGVDFATYYDWKNRISSMSGDTKQDDLLKELSGSGLSEQQQITVYFDLGGYSISEKKLSQGATVGLDEADLQRWRYRVDQAKAAGQDNTQILDMLRQSSDLSTDQKNQIGKLFLSDVIVIPDEVDVDFTNDTTFTLSQLPDSAQDRYEAFAQDYLTPQQWSDIYTKYSGYKNKAQKIAAMVADGYSQSDAETLYSWMSKSIDDSYYVGKMSDTARYYWQNGVEAEDLMSAKQWLTFTDEYAGADYQTALEAMQDAGYAADYADILARLLSQM